MGSRNVLKATQTVHINTGGGTGGGLGGLAPIVAAVVVCYIAATVAAALIHALAVVLAWFLIVSGAALVLSGALAIVFRARIRHFMVRRGDPRADHDRIMAEKRVELGKIRAMRLQIEAARIAGVEITPDMLRMAEDPELAELVLRFKAAANGTSRWLYPDSGPRGEVTD